jgi:hypothetical protein
VPHLWAAEGFPSPREELKPEAPVQALLSWALRRLWDRRGRRRRGVVGHGTLRPYARRLLLAISCSTLSQRAIRRPLMWASQGGLREI